MIFGEFFSSSSVWFFKFFTLTHIGFFFLVGLLVRVQEFSSFKLALSSALTLTGIGVVTVSVGYFLSDDFAFGTLADLSSLVDLFAMFLGLTFTIAVGFKLAKLAVQLHKAWSRHVEMEQ